MVAVRNLDGAARISVALAGLQGSLEECVEGSLHPPLLHSCPAFSFLCSWVKHVSQTQCLRGRPVQSCRNICRSPLAHLRSLTGRRSTLEPSH